MRGYLRKMATEGYIISVDMSNIKELILLLRSISKNMVFCRTNIKSIFIKNIIKKEVSIWQ